MSLQINPSSVQLGKDAVGNIDNIYVSSYFASPLPTGSCILPGKVTYTPGNPSLIPLQPSCTFTFNDVLDIPPIPPPPPPIKACESLTATTNIVTTQSTRNTSLSLVAAGPIPSANGSSDCSISLIGIIDVTACVDFTATSAITFGNAASGSNLSMVATGAPNCGVDLRGRIDISACESFTASSSIAYGGAMKGSYLNLVSRSLPNCGLDITGTLNVNACENFSAQSNISMTGAAVTKSIFSISPTSAPNCGFTLTGDVVIDACTDFSASGGITFRGSAIKSSSVQVTSSSQPTCGMVLSGLVEIDACTTFNAINNLRITGPAVTTITPLSISSYDAPDCGLILNGEIIIDNVCSSVSIVQDDAPSSITVTVGGEAFSTQPIILRSKVETESGCDSVISLAIESISLEMPGASSVVNYTPGTMTGCCWDENTDGPFLYRDEYTDEMYIAGSLPTPCFICDTGGFTLGNGLIPFVYADITLRSLNVDYLKGSDCCSSPTTNEINLCQGAINFSNPANVSQFSMTSQQVTMLAAGTETKIIAGDVYVGDGYSYAELEPRSLTIDDSSATNSYLYATAYSLLYNTPTSTLELDADNAVITAQDSSNISLLASGMTVSSSGEAYAYVGSGGVSVREAEFGRKSELTPTALELTGGIATAKLVEDTLYLTGTDANSDLNYYSLKISLGTSKSGLFDHTNLKFTSTAGSHTTDAEKTEIKNSTNTTTLKPAEISVGNDTSTITTVLAPGKATFKTAATTQIELNSTSLKVTGAGGSNDIDLSSIVGKGTASFQALTICTDAATNTKRTVYVLMAG